MTARRFALCGWGIAVAMLLFYAGSRATGLFVNVTASLPPGLWRQDAQRDIRRGAIVIVRPPLSPVIARLKAMGYARQLWLKPVAAIAGDAVVVSAHGIAVNGLALPNSTSLARDGHGAALPHIGFGRYVVPAGMVWLISTYNRDSLDSRYFGPVPVSAIEASAHPVWVAA